MDVLVHVKYGKHYMYRYILQRFGVVDGSFLTVVTALVICPVQTNKLPCLSFFARKYCPPESSHSIALVHGWQVCHDINTKLRWWAWLTKEITFPRGFTLQNPIPRASLQFSKLHPFLSITDPALSNPFQSITVVRNVNLIQISNTLWIVQKKLLALSTYPPFAS